MLTLHVFRTSRKLLVIEPDSLKLDGINLMPYLQGDEQGDPHAHLFWRKLGNAVARIID